jgi:GTPase SAR1 family protein
MPDSLNRLDYKGVDLVFLCFDASNAQSLVNLSEIWMDEVRAYTGETISKKNPLTRHKKSISFWSWLRVRNEKREQGQVLLILVGCKVDLREDEETQGPLETLGSSMVTRKEVRSITFRRIYQKAYISSKAY